MSKNSNTRVRRQRSISQVHFGFSSRQTNVPGKPTSMFNIGSGFCEDAIDKFEHQVAGHEFNDEKDTVGILKCYNGTILKPIIKPDLGQREIKLYEEIAKSIDPYLAQLREFVPMYHGVRKVNIKEKDVEFLILENLCATMLEPCVMDIKIGQRTWDPHASTDKIKRELEKYAQCKKDVAFCIPGFQIFTLSHGTLKKYDKNYGKTLDGKSIYGAIKTFLNFDGKGSICRSLIVQLLSCLWKLQKWARNQTALRFYSSSLLIVYDAKGLRDCCANGTNILSQGLERRCSVEIHPVNRKISTGTMGYTSQMSNERPNFSGQLSSNGPIFSAISAPPSTPMDTHSSFRNHQTSIPNSKSWHYALNKLQRSHSFHNNYEDNISKMKLSYNSMLDDLVSDDTKKHKPWATVKLIDFSHTFPADEKLPDFNFSQGLNNVVKIFEHILSEIESHVATGSHTF